MSRSTCTFDQRHGWRTREHLSSCRDSDCTGCRPCGKSHCEFRGRGCPNHVDRGAGVYTCPKCIGRVRSDLIAIGVRAVELLGESLQAGVDSEAANLSGPAASPEQIAARRRWDQTRGWCSFPRTIAADDPHHPYLVLGRWDMALRESYDMPTDLFVTVERAKDYLLRMLKTEFPHTREFENFAVEIATCKTHIEDVLSDSRQPEKGAPCPTCADELAQDDEKAPRLLKRFGSTERFDTWHCPRIAAHWWSDEDYRLRVAGDYLKHATALTASQIHEAHGVSAGSVRGWASLGKVRKRGRDANGLTLYDVADVLAMRTEVVA